MDVGIASTLRVSVLKQYYAYTIRTCVLHLCSYPKSPFTLTESLLQAGAVTVSLQKQSDVST